MGEIIFKWLVDLVAAGVVVVVAWQITGGWPRGGVPLFTYLVVWPIAAFIVWRIWV